MLDEYNPSDTSGEGELKTVEGLKNLGTYCYSPLYDQMFSASDYLAVAETGTDLWLTQNNKTTLQQLFYYEGLTTNYRVNRYQNNESHSFVTGGNLQSYYN